MNSLNASAFLGTIMPSCSASRSVKVFALSLCLVLGGLQLAGCSSREQRAQAYYEHGMSYLEKKDYVKARIEIRNALQLKPEYARGLAGACPNRRARQELARRSPEICVRSSSSIPKDVDAHIKLGRLFLFGRALSTRL